MQLNSVTIARIRTYADGREYAGSIAFFPPRIGRVLIPRTSGCRPSVLKEEI